MNLESRKSIDRGVIKVLKKIRISQNNTCINPKKIILLTVLILDGKFY